MVVPVLILLVDALLAAAALIGPPNIFGAPWENLWRSDLGLFFLAYAPAHLITAAARTWRMLRHPIQHAAAASVPQPDVQPAPQHF